VLDHTDQTDQDDDSRENAEVIADAVAVMRDNPICMLTTVASDGALTSRPMTVQLVESRGVAWMFARAGSDVAMQVQEDPRVNLAFAGNGEWVSLAGSASVEVDEVRARDLWNGIESAWFEGPDDPMLRLVHVVPDSAQLWDAPGPIGTMVALARAIVSDAEGDAAAVGDSRAVEM